MLLLLVVVSAHKNGITHNWAVCHSIPRPFDKTKTTARSINSEKRKFYIYLQNRVRYALCLYMLEAAPVTLSPTDTLVYITLSVCTGWCCCYYRCAGCSYALSIMRSHAFSARSAQLVLLPSSSLPLLLLSLSILMLRASCAPENAIKIHTLDDDDDAHSPALCQKSIYIRRRCRNQFAYAFD